MTKELKSYGLPTTENWTGKWNYFLSIWVEFAGDLVSNLHQAGLLYSSNDPKVFCSFGKSFFLWVFPIFTKYEGVAFFPFACITSLLGNTNELKLHIWLLSTPNCFSFQNWYLHILATLSFVDVELFNNKEMLAFAIAADISRCKLLLVLIFKPKLGFMQVNYDLREVCL